MQANPNNRKRYHCKLCDSSDRHERLAQHLDCVHFKSGEARDDVFVLCGGEGNVCGRCSLPRRGRQLGANWEVMKQLSVAVKAGQENAIALAGQAKRNALFKCVVCGAFIRKDKSPAHRTLCTNPAVNETVGEQSRLSIADKRLDKNKSKKEIKTQQLLPDTRTTPSLDLAFQEQNLELSGQLSLLRKEKKALEEQVAQLLEEVGQKNKIIESQKETIDSQKETMSLVTPAAFLATPLDTASATPAAILETPFGTASVAPFAVTETPIAAPLTPFVTPETLIVASVTPTTIPATPFDKASVTPFAVTKTLIAAPVTPFATPETFIATSVTPTAILATPFDTVFCEHGSVRVMLHEAIRFNDASFCRLDTSERQWLQESWGFALKVSRQKELSVPRDGNSLFGCFSRLLADQQSTHSVFRTSCLDYIVRYPTKFIRYFKGGDGKVDMQALENHVTAMRKDGTRGTAIELEAFALQHKCKVEVIDYTLTKRKMYGTGEKQYTIAWLAGHYTAICHGSQRVLTGQWVHKPDVKNEIPRIINIIEHVGEDKVKFMIRVSRANTRTCILGKECLQSCLPQILSDFENVNKLTQLQNKDQEGHQPVCTTP